LSSFNSSLSSSSSLLSRDLGEFFRGFDGGSFVLVEDGWEGGFGGRRSGRSGGVFELRRRRRRGCCRRSFDVDFLRWRNSVGDGFLGDRLLEKIRELRRRE